MFKTPGWLAGPIFNIVYEHVVQLINCMYSPEKGSPVSYGPLEIRAQGPCARAQSHFRAQNICAHKWKIRAHALEICAQVLKIRAQVWRIRAQVWKIRAQAWNFRAQGRKIRAHIKNFVHTHGKSVRSAR